MGMYTTLKFKAIVKPEYQQFVPQWHSDTEMRTEWNIQEFPEYANYSRSSSIPFGGCHGHTNSFNDGVWTVECALKNYDDTIEQFMTYVASKMFESVEYCITEYEEDYYFGIDHTNWELKDGQMVKTVVYSDNNNG